MATADPIRLRAEATKARRPDVLPLSGPVRSALSERAQGADEAGKVFRAGVPSHHTFQSDLERASIQQTDARGHKVDFHAFRTTLITNLARAGVTQRAAMALARHSDPRLTAHVYTDTDALPLADAVALLPNYDSENVHGDAHGHAQAAVSPGPAVARNDNRSRSRRRRKMQQSQGFAGVSGCQHVTPADAEHKWSRGESNPRPETVSRRPLRA